MAKRECPGLIGSLCWTKDTGKRLHWREIKGWVLTATKAAHPSIRIAYASKMLSGASALLVGLPSDGSVSHWHSNGQPSRA